MRRRGAALVAVATFAAACTSAAEAPRGPAGPAMDGKLRWAIEDAAGRSGVPLDQVVVLAAERVTWSDGAVGCPQPGLTYTQALVPGHRIVLRAGGQVLNYHSSERGQPFLCPADRVRPPAVDTRPD